MVVGFLQAHAHTGKAQGHGPIGVSDDLHVYSKTVTVDGRNLIFDMNDTTKQGAYVDDILSVVTRLLRWDLVACSKRPNRAAYTEKALDHVFRAIKTLDDRAGLEQLNLSAEPAPGRARPSRVFISYTRSSFAVAEAVKTALEEEHGIKTFLDKDMEGLGENSFYGGSTGQIMTTAMSECELAIMLIDRRYTERIWCEKEAAFLWDRHRYVGNVRILPVFLTFDANVLFRENYPHLKEVLGFVGLNPKHWGESQSQEDRQQMTSSFTTKKSQVIVEKVVSALLSKVKKSKKDDHF